ncbi:hypothetical protein BDV98DRAFT_47982 [Pterulicium gracile]|uniref:Smr domain-containing protein n=1 Tax=Pterulicium gracile TaxID=1884261 RepID=A0A5C3QND9_9AGAR|nr:hypothetical protein BDV98DRAFT_47982 [Pterula gracilis]
MLLGERDTDAPKDPGEQDEMLDELRQTLGLLSAAAAEHEETQLCMGFDDVVNISDDGTASSPELCESTSSDATSVTASTSPSPPHSFQVPLGFLEAALPYIDKKTIRTALEDADITEDGSVDMEALVDTILTRNYIRELEERGMEDELVEARGSSQWETAQVKRPSKRVKKSTNKSAGEKLVFGDPLQRHRRPQTPQGGVLSPGTLPPPDPWIQLTSLSDHLATLVPSCRSEYFRSAFHSDKHDTPVIALRTALHQACRTMPGGLNPENVDKEILFTFLDLLLPRQDSECRPDLVSDAQLALVATGGEISNALDLVKVLTDLDQDYSSRNYTFGVYHSSSSPPSPLPMSSTSSEAPRSIPTVTLPSGPPASPLPAQYKHSRTGPSTVSANKPSPFQWQKVHERRPNHGPSPHAAFIPAYQLQRGRKAQISASPASVQQAAISQRRMEYNMQKSNELVKQASRMWQKGKNKSYGGEVALYFAERAREFQEAARVEALNAARAMVMSRRTTSGNQDTIDLHGTTAHEAVVIVDEVLEASPASPRELDCHTCGSCLLILDCCAEKPLTIVTGRGTHSAGQVSVLKPALRKSLVSRGWNVSSWDGGLTVRGKA